MGGAGFFFFPLQAGAASARLLLLFFPVPEHLAPVDPPGKVWNNAAGPL